MTCAPDLLLRTPEGAAEVPGLTLPPAPLTEMHPIPLTGREHIAGYPIAADQSAPAREASRRKPTTRSAGLRVRAAFWKTTPALPNAPCKRVWQPLLASPGVGRHDAGGLLCGQRHSVRICQATTGQRG